MNQLNEILKSQRTCPHCGQETFGFKERSLLFSSPPSFCKNCEELVQTSKKRDYLPFLILVLLVIIIAFLDLDPLLIFLFILSFFFRGLYTKPFKYIPGKPKLCTECGRDNEGYYYSSDKICANCKDKA